MKNFLKKSLAFLIASALIVQLSIFVPSMTLTSYADSEENVIEKASTAFHNSKENVDIEVSDEEDVFSDDTFSEETSDGTITDQTEMVAVVPDVLDVAVSGKEEVVTLSEIKENEEERSADNQTRAPPEEGSGLTVLAFSSDVHNKTDHKAATRLGNWIDNIHSIYNQQIEVMGFCGDLADSQAGTNYWNLVQEVMDVVNGNIPDKIGQAVYTTGNHEYDHKDDSSEFTYDYNDTTRQYLEDQSAVEADNYHIYCIGTGSYHTDGWNSVSNGQVEALKAYLDSIQDDKPIIILNHYPLHYTSNRSIAKANLMIDALNNAAGTGKKIVYLWGHNHTDAPTIETHYDEVFKPGDSIEFARNQSRTLQFYYAAAGCMSDSEYNINARQGSGFVLGKGLVITINSKNLLSFTYYDENGIDRTENGSYEEKEPVPVTGITINDVTQIDEDGQPVVVEVPDIEVGSSLQLSVTLEPEDTTDTKLTWSSSDPSVATVSAGGKVKGISEGKAEIIVSAGSEESGSNAIVSDCIVINVIPRTSPDPYYVIKIGDYALSSKVSSAIMSNTNGYQYHGLEAVVYDENSLATQDILWKLEEAGDTTNGFYIKSYNGAYLNARYESNGRGYTGILIVSDSPEEIWIVNGGFENWQGDGSTLQSTNASTSSKAMFLATTQANNNGPYFFTVRSSSDSSVQRTSRLIEPIGIKEPVPVEDIAIEPLTLDIEVGKSSDLKATVFPENADDKTVSWYSADEAIATVSNAGRVKGISEGETDITAKTTDGQKTATCHVKVVPRTSEEQYFVIRIGDYAMSSKHSSATMSNTSGYRYHGLEAIKYDENSPAPQEILWTLEETDNISNGYYIKSFDGAYLSATYERVGQGYTGSLIVSDSPQEIWIVNSGFENWQGDGSTLQSTNASTSSKAMFLATTQANNNGPYFFTVRSTSSSDSTVQRTSQLIEPEELAHKWSEPTWTWNDYTSAFATFIYANDPAHTKVIEADIAKDETATGFIPYTATVTFNGQTYTDTRKDTLTVSNKLELNDGIIIHILLKNLPEGSVPTDYTISYNDMDGNTYTDVPLASMTENVFSVEVDSPEMTQKVNIIIKYKGTEIYSNYTSVQKYCDTVIETSKEDTYRELCYAILNYGTEAQKKFNKYTDDLADANHPDKPYEIKEIPKTPIEKTQDERISAVGMSLNLQYETEMFFYFTPAGGFSASDISIDVRKDGKPVEEGEFACEIRKDGKLLVKVKKIAATELSDTITVTASIENKESTQVKASPISYLYAAQSVSGMEELCRAMYNYHLKAVGYFAYFQ